MLLLACVASAGATLILPHAQSVGGAERRRCRAYDIASKRHGIAALMRLDDAALEGRMAVAARIVSEQSGVAARVLTDGTIEFVPMEFIREQSGSKDAKPVPSLARPPKQPESSPRRSVPAADKVGYTGASVGGEMPRTFPMKKPAAAPPPGASPPASPPPEEIEKLKADEAAEKAAEEAATRAFAGWRRPSAAPPPAVPPPDAPSTKSSAASARASLAAVMTDTRRKKLQQRLLPPQAVYELLQSPEESATLVDMRTFSEQKAGTALIGAVTYPLDDLLEGLEDTPPPGDEWPTPGMQYFAVPSTQTVILACEDGETSLVALDVLYSRYDRIHAIKGGAKACARDAAGRLDWMTAV